MLENKLGIKSAPELAEAEERISKKKAIELLKVAWWSTGAKSIKKNYKD